MLAFLDILFFVFHTALMGFNLLGWAWRRTRVAHLIALSLTAFSWFVVGAFYGWGYCFCTDWHFRVRERLGYADPDTNYVQLLVNKLFGDRRLDRGGSVYRNRHCHRVRLVARLAR